MAGAVKADVHRSVVLDGDEFDIATVSLNRGPDEVDHVLNLFAKRLLGGCRHKESRKHEYRPGADPLQPWGLLIPALAR